MTVLVQNCVTMEFFQNDPEVWNTDPRQAKVFATSADAVQFCVRHHFGHVQVLLRFEGKDEGLNVVLPMTGCR